MSFSLISKQVLYLDFVIVAIALTIICNWWLTAWSYYRDACGLSRAKGESWKKVRFWKLRTSSFFSCFLCPLSFLISGLFVKTCFFVCKDISVRVLESPGIQIFLFFKLCTYGKASFKFPVAAPYMRNLTVTWLQWLKREGLRMLRYCHRMFMWCQISMATGLQ